MFRVLPKAAIQYGSGWDIALDMVFSDRVTAGTIAARLLSAIHALVREAVDASMCERNVAKKGFQRNCLAADSARKPRPRARF